MKCPKCGREPKRSTEANRRYWALLAEIADKVKPDGNYYSRESWHIYMKGKFLGMTEVKLPNGKTMLIPKSSADLEKGEFNDYSTQVEQWAAERGVWLDE